MELSHLPQRMLRWSKEAPRGSDCHPANPQPCTSATSTHRFLHSAARVGQALYAQPASQGARGKGARAPRVSVPARSMQP